jgi:hypothetical protein
MNERKTILAEAVCPFYLAEAKQKIYCEGLSHGSTIHLAFGSARNCEKYKAAKCRSSYKSCLISRMLFEKYE